jgi:hypothetical protein
VLGTGPGYVRAATGPLTRGLHAVADVPFRRAAFLHEARRAGYRKLDDVRTLIRESEQSPRKRQELAEIARKAQEEIVRFGRLTDVEQRYLRHLLFVYSWTKGATRYASRFPGAHPVQTAAFVQLGREGEQRVEDAVGNLPAWLRGAIPLQVDEQGDPTFVLPFGISPLGTGLDVARAAEGTFDILRGEEFDPFAGEDPLDLANPLIGSFLEARSGGRPVHESLRDTVAPARLAHRLLNTGEGETFPGTAGEAIGSFLGGSLYPREASGRAIREGAEERRRAELDPDERLHEDFRADIRRARRLFKSAGARMPRQYEELASRKLRVEVAELALREELEVERLTEAQRVAVLLAVVGEIPALEEAYDGLALVYQDAQGDARDFGETPSGAMHQLRLILEDLLGFNAFADYRQILNQIEDRNRAG